MKPVSTGVDNKIVRTRLLLFGLLFIFLSCKSNGDKDTSGNTGTSRDTTHTDTQLPPANSNPDAFLKVLVDSLKTKDIGKNKILPIKPVATSNAGYICGTPIPKSLGQLNQIDRSSSIVTNNKGIDLNLFGITAGGLKKNDVLIISNFMAYRDYDCGEGKKRVSVGMQIYIHAYSNKKFSIRTADIKKIAAAAELGYATSEYHLHIFGLENANDIYKNLPGSTLDVEAYSKIVSSFDALLNGLSASVRIDPVVTEATPLQ